MGQKLETIIQKEEQRMDIAIVVLKNTQQQILCELVFNMEQGTLTCKRPFTIGWVPLDKKLPRVVMQLSLFPPLLDALVSDISENEITIQASDVMAVYYAGQLNPAVIADYEKRRQAVYGKIAVVKAMPNELSGRA